ncbi:MAG: PEGA domain-containing protein, partial [Candidatus Eremiobacteraeota bacterium]|nr:PEGA domain-containing protein [Candidatus Eremiobacteraeota bacterium]
MLRRLATAVLCVLLLAAVPTGSLYVTTLPTGADVWIDGTYVGRSPLVLGALAAGHHTVGLTKTGWDPLQLDVSVVAAQTTLSSTRLEPARTGGLHA